MEMKLRSPFPAVLLLAVVVALLTAGCQSYGGLAPADWEYFDSTLDLETSSSDSDPGSGKWQIVKAGDIGKVCHLDRERLEEIQDFPEPWMIVRFGKICWTHPQEESYMSGHSQSWSELFFENLCRDKSGPECEKSNNASATKTLTATMLGFLNREISCNGGRQILPEDLVNDWINSKNLRKLKEKFGDLDIGAIVDGLGFLDHDSQISNVLGMVPSGDSNFKYRDALANLLGPIMEVGVLEIPKDRRRFKDLDALKDFFFRQMGMKESIWSLREKLRGDSYWQMANGWNSSLADMARLGLLILQEGRWDRRQFVPRNWVKAMVRPPFPQANCAYGYLTWLNANRHWETLECPMPGRENSLVDSAPTVACSPSAGATSSRGLWQANGAGGQLIIGDDELEMLLITRNFGSGFVTGDELWNQVVAAVKKCHVTGGDL